MSEIVSQQHAAAAKMTASELTRRMLDFCEGLDDVVEQAPDFTVEEINKLVAEVAAMPEAQQLDECPSVICAVVKGLKSGAFQIVDVM